MPRKAVHHLRLARFDLFAAAVGSLWLMLWLAPAVESAGRVNPAIGRLGSAGSLGLGTLIAAGLVGGYLWMNRATRLAMAMLLGAVAAAMAFGPVSGVLALLVAAGIVMHNVVGRYVPAVGIVAAGLLWAAGMAIVNPHLGFGHPIALAMTHVMACAVLVHIYERRRPMLSTESGVLIGVGWAFWILLGVSLIGQRRQTITAGGEHALIWIGPMAALAAWVVVAAIMVRLRVDAARLRRAAALWLLVYAAGWLVGAGLPGRAAAVVGLAFAGWALDRWQRGRIAAQSVDTGYRAG